MFDEFDLKALPQCAEDRYVQRVVLLRRGPNQSQYERNDSDGGKNIALPPLIRWSYLESNSYFVNARDIGMPLLQVRG
jgi:hypothetical protein